jgi:hypothetical protein
MTIVVENINNSSSTNRCNSSNYDPSQGMVPHAPLKIVEVLLYFTYNYQGTQARPMPTL